MHLIFPISWSNDWGQPYITVDEWTFQWARSRCYLLLTNIEDLPVVQVLSLITLQKIRGLVIVFTHDWGLTRFDNYRETVFRLYWGSSVIRFATAVPGLNGRSLAAVTACRNLSERRLPSTTS